MKQDNSKRKKLKTFIISIIIAIAVWMIVDFTQTPSLSTKITDIPIQYIGSDALKERGLIILGTHAKSNVTVQASGTRMDLLKNSKSVTMKIDVSKITAPGEYYLGGTISSDNSLSCDSPNPSTVEVIIDTLEEKTVPIKLEQTGSPKNMLVESKAQTDTITVSGASSELEKASYALVDIDASVITEDTELELPFLIMNEKDAPLPPHSTVKADIERITVENTVYDSVSLPVKARLAKGIEYKYWLNEEQTVYSPASVQAGVKPGVNPECVYAVIDSVSTDKNEFTLITEEGMYIPEEERTINIKPALVEKTERHMDISIRAENTGEGLNAEFSDKLTGMLLSAPEAVLNEGNISGSMDLSNLKEGVHRVEVTLDDIRVTSAEALYAYVTITAQ